MAELVEAIWTDAWSDEENFQTIHGITLTHGPMIVHTIGWLLKNDDAGVSIANEKSVQDDGEVVYRGRTYIPKGMLTSVVPFKLAKPRKAKIKPISPDEPLDLQ